MRLFRSVERGAFTTSPNLDQNYVVITNASSLVGFATFKSGLIANNLQLYGVEQTPSGSKVPNQKEE